MNDDGDVDLSYNSAELLRADPAGTAAGYNNRGALRTACTVGKWREATSNLPLLVISATIFSQAPGFI